MKNIYDLNFPLKRGEIYLKPEDSYIDQDLKTGKFVPNEPWKVRVDEGRKFYDLLRFQDVYNFAFSERIYQLLKENNVTGFKGFAINVDTSDKKYYCIQIIGKAGKLDRPEKSGFQVGYDLDYDTWDGSDFFIPDETMLTFCTEKVRDLIIKSKATNVEFKDIKEVKWYNAVPS